MMHPTKLVCMGDSLTEAYLVDEASGWCSLLAKKLGIEVINSGISGDTTGGMLARFQTMVLDHQPSHVIIMGGTNDLSYDLPNNLIFSNITAMIRLARHNNILPVVGIPVPVYFDENDEENGICLGLKSLSQRMMIFQKELRQLVVEDGFPMIDFAEGMTEDLFLKDKVHPNEKGHERMMLSVLEVINDYKSC